MPNSSISQPCGQTASALRGKRVILAENEGITSMMLQRALRRQGAQIVGVCHSAAEGVAIAARERPDLVLIGTIPQPGANFMEAIRAMSQANASCVVLMAASVSEGDMPKFREAGVAGIIKKPFEAGQLLPLLEEVCTELWTLPT